MVITIKRKRIPFGNREVYNTYMRNFSRTRKIKQIMTEIDMLIANLNHLNVTHIIDNEEYTNLKYLFQNIVYNRRYKYFNQQYKSTQNHFEISK